MATVFSGLSPLVIEDVVDEDEWILARARTPIARCPASAVAPKRAGCTAITTVTLADVPIDARRVVVRVRARRLVCPTRGCRQTFREQLPGILERYQRRTPWLGVQVGSGPAAGRPRWCARCPPWRWSPPGTPRCVCCYACRCRCGRCPACSGWTGFARRRHHRNATVFIDARTRQQIDVLPDHKADTLEGWLRAHPGVEIVCRDSSGAYAETVRRALPGALQFADRWHIWHNLGEPS